MRRGSLIIDDTPLSGVFAKDSDESDDEPQSRPVAIKWGLPDGFAVRLTQQAG